MNIRIENFTSYEIQSALKDKDQLFALKQLLGEKSHMNKRISMAQAQLLVKNTKSQDCRALLACRIPYFLMELTLKQMNQLIMCFRNEENRLICFEFFVENFPGLEGDLDVLLNSAFKNTALKERALEILEEHGIVQANTG